MSYDDEMGGNDTPKKPSKDSTSKTILLDSYSKDLTKLAQEGKIDPIIGRDSEIERMIEILSRRKKNNPILIGESGVGKTAIAEGLAQKIYEKNVPKNLQDKKLLSLDVAALVSGTKYRGQFEERMKNILAELAEFPNVILFIDEIHTIIGAGGVSGTLDLSNMLKPALARGEFQCIGATTIDEYTKHIEKDSALERRFQKVVIEPTSPDDTIKIINNIKIKYEEHHNVAYSDEAIKASVLLTSRYITDRHLPDKAIDAIDEAGSRVRIKNLVKPEVIKDIEKKLSDIEVEKKEAVKRQNYEMAAKLRDRNKELTAELEKQNRLWEEDIKKSKFPVTEDDISEVVSKMSGIPLNKINETESSVLVNMEETFSSKVIGQDEAIKKLVKAIKRSRAGLKDNNRPIGTFLFIGESGVGKTQLSKVLAEHMFEGRDSLIRIDMSEYSEKINVSRLIGAAPGYVGHEEGGQLTEAVRRKPYSVILLDEIEKAHSEVFNLFLQVLDEGMLTDSLGRKVNFKNTIIIMTSNVGTRKLKDFGTGLGFKTSSKETAKNEDSKKLLETELKKTFAPEFINRIDDIIYFNSLKKTDIAKILDVELIKLYDKIDKLGHTIEISDKAKNFLCENGYTSENGARPLKRVIQQHLEDLIAEELIQNKTIINNRCKIQIDLHADKTKLSIKITKLKK